MIVARFFFILLYGGSGSGSVATPRIRIRLLQKVTDPYGSGSATLLAMGQNQFIGALAICAKKILIDVVINTKN